MKRILNVSVSLIVLLAAGTAMAGRELECSIAKDAKTINGIRTLKYTKASHEGRGTLTIGRDGRGLETISSTSGNELYWGESEHQPPGSNYSVEDTLYFRKTRDGKGVPSFALVMERLTLSGPNCDGYHMCRVQADVIESVSMNCTDSDDAPRPSPDPHRCSPDPHAECNHGY